MIVPSTNEFPSPHGIISAAVLETNQYVIPGSFVMPSPGGK